MLKVSKAAVNPADLNSIYDLSSNWALHTLSLFNHNRAKPFSQAFSSDAGRAEAEIKNESKMCSQFLVTLFLQNTFFKCISCQT